MLKYQILAFLSSAYIFLRFILPVRVRWYWKIPLTIFFLITVYFSVMKLFYFPIWFDIKKIPVFLINSGMYLHVTAVIFSALLFFKDLMQIIFMIFQKILKKTRPEYQLFRSGKIYIILIIFSLILTGIGFYFGNMPPKVHEIIIPYSNLPEKMDGMKAVLIADTHIIPQTSKSYIQEIVRLTNQQEADFIFLAGDIVDALPSDIGDIVNEFSGLKAKYGIFFVTGNHEGGPHLNQWIIFFQEMGICVLRNEHVNFPEFKCSIIGVNDIMQGADLSQAVKGVPAEYFKILLNHRPKGAKQNAKMGIDLQLSGHTHGGMIFLMNFIVAAMNTGFVSGLYHVENMYLYVTNGLCVGRGFPVRLGVPPEIVLIRLKRMENEPERKFFDVF